MTLAVADAFLSFSRSGSRRYPQSACPVHADLWVEIPLCGIRRNVPPLAEKPHPQPYGNGSAMLVSSAAWLFNDLETVRHMARLSAVVTHNHPEGIKGAQATASAIYLARTGSAKAEIKACIEDNFHYDLSRSYDEILCLPPCGKLSGNRPRSHHRVSGRRKF